MVLAALTALLLTTAKPSFDCARASGVERTVCAEPRLAILDGRLSELYHRALQAAPNDAQETRKAQRAWLRKRDEACAKSAATALCLDGYYRNRIDQFDHEQRQREETAGHAPADGTYSGFVGRWRVVGVTAADDAPNVTDWGTDDPRYMGLVLSATPDAVSWLNGTKENSTTDVCRGPSFAPRSTKAPLPSGWKAVTLKCREGEYWTEDRDDQPLALTLKAQDIVELEWDDGALLHLKRVPVDRPVPPPPHAAPTPTLPPGFDGHRVTAADMAYFKALQSAVRRHDRQWLAAQGTIQVNRPDGASHAYNPDEIKEAFDWIITPDVERAVLAQRAEDLFENDHGLMVGRGEIWFDQTSVDGRHWIYTIIAVNQTP